MSLTQFAFILESILPHGFFTVKAFWQQTDSISRKTHRSAALQRTGGLLQLFPLDKSYYMGLYFLYFHSHNIRKFVNILPAIFGR